MSTYYLYVKTHNQTGLKYLGQTRKDPTVYKGSGIKWKTHCEKHGYDVTTKILLETNNFKELREKGIYYSNLWNITKSNEWANVYNEHGQGGRGTKMPIISRAKSSDEKKYDLLLEIFQTHLAILWQEQLNQT